MALLLPVVALTVAGLMVGVELSVALVVNPVLDRLPGTDGLLGRADGARVLGRVMPFWYAACIVVAVALAVVRRDDGGTAALAGAAALLVLSIVMSVLLLVPINNQARTWDAESAPADWRDRMHRWDRLHYGRLAVITTAFVLLCVGILQSS